MAPAKSVITACQPVSSLLRAEPLPARFRLLVISLLEASSLCSGFDEQPRFQILALTAAKAIHRLPELEHVYSVQFCPACSLHIQM